MAVTMPTAQAMRMAMLQLNAHAKPSWREKLETLSQIFNMLENVASYFVPVQCHHQPNPALHRKTIPVGGTLAWPQYENKNAPKMFVFFFCFWSVCVLWLTKGGVGLRQRYAGNAFALFGILFQHFNAPTTVAPHSQTNTLRSWTVEPSGRSSPQMELSCTEAKSLLCNLKRVLSVLA